MDGEIKITCGSFNTIKHSVQKEVQSQITVSAIHIEAIIDEEIIIRGHSYRSQRNQKYHYHQDKEAQPILLYMLQMYVMNLNARLE